MSEKLNLVDENDKIIGTDLRDNCHQQGLWHRRSTVFVFNSEGKLLVQKRAPNMSRPNMWCGSASGHVLAGESYEDAAQRELKEELGIECDLKEVGQLKVEVDFSLNDKEREHHKLFSCQSDGPFNIQQEELSQVKFISLDKIKKNIQKNPENYTPGFIEEVKYYLKNINI